MKRAILAVPFFIVSFCNGWAQTDTVSTCPNVDIEVQLLADTCKFGDDIIITIPLINNSSAIQSVWFDRPRPSTGGPAWTSVNLVNKETSKSVLKYENRAILESQLYSSEQVRKGSYQLKPGQKISRRFNLYNLVVLSGDRDYL